jgi:hypothetical protein
MAMNQYQQLRQQLYQQLHEQLLTQLRNEITNEVHRQVLELKDGAVRDLRRQILDNLQYQLGILGDKVANLHERLQALEPKPK